MKKLKFIYYFFGIISICSTAQANCDIEHWKNFKEMCNKSYSKEEDELRMKMFHENCIKVDEHNKKFEKKEVTFKVKLNCKESDRLENRFKVKSLGYRVGFQKNNQETFTYDGSPTPESFDWRTEKEISPVANQGTISSSWAVATSDILQDQCLVQRDIHIPRPSSQELVDCCKGGRMDTAFDYIMANGIISENNYSSNGESGECQRNNNSRSAVEISGYRNSPEGNVEALKAFIVQHGPVTAAVDQSSWAFQHYSEGIFQEPECSSIDLNLALGVLGYGKENGIEYWICKSTLGPKWGDNGYIKIATKNNQCGIATEASSPIITDCPSH